MEGFIPHGHVMDDPSQMDVICIDDNVRDNARHVMMGQKVMKDQIHVQGPEHRGVFGPLGDASRRCESVKKLFVWDAIFIFLKP